MNVIGIEIVFVIINDGYRDARSLICLGFVFFLSIFTNLGAIQLAMITPPWRVGPLFNLRVSAFKSLAK